MSQQNRHRFGERGQSIVLIALMLTGLVAFVGLALDGGQVYEWRSKMQNAADSGAFRGARELADNRFLLTRTKIQEYVVGNGTIGNGATDFDTWYEPSDTRIDFGTTPAVNDNCVKVNAHKNFQTLIISFLGFSTLDASATAKACVGVPVQPEGIRPFGVVSQTFNYVDEYCLFDSGDQGDNFNPLCLLPTAGSFGWLDLDGGNNGTGDTVNWLDNGLLGAVHIATFPDPNTPTPNCPPGDAILPNLTLPQWLHRDSGASVGNNDRDITGALNRLISNRTPITIPIYDWAACTGSNGAIHVVGFIKFVVTSYSLRANGGHKFIKGHFLQYIEPGAICIGCPPIPGNPKAVQLVN